MNSLTSQLKQVLRRLWRAPFFTIVTLITLGSRCRRKHCSLQRRRGGAAEAAAVSACGDAGGRVAHGAGTEYGRNQYGAVELLHLSRAESSLPGHRTVSGRFGRGDEAGQSRAGAGAGCDRWCVADFGCHTDVGTVVQPRRRSAERGGYGDAGLRLLAAALRERPVRLSDARSRWMARHGR